MATLTAAQIKTILLTGTYAETVEINASLLQNDERRKYPSIDVQNITGEENLKGFPVSTTGQTFLIHLFYRYRSFGAQEEPNIKLIEDEIYDTIFTDSNFATTNNLTVAQTWQRGSDTFPVRRSHSTLTVTTEEAIFVDNAYTITVPTIGTDVQLISKPIDSDTDTVEDLLDDGLILKTEGIIKSKRTIILEFETVSAVLTAFQGFKTGRSAQSFTIKQPAGNETLSAFVTNISTSEVIPTKQSMTVQLDVVTP